MNPKPWRAWLLLAIAVWAFVVGPSAAAFALAGDADAGQNGEIGNDLDKVGNRLSRVSPLSTLNSQQGLTYNARDWLDGDTYNANGSTVTGSLSPVASGPSPVAGTDIYDFEERLIVRSRNDGTTVNVNYDADGIRVSKSILDQTGALISSTHWLVDTNNLTGYAQVLEERVTTSAGTTLKTYTYGSALITRAETAFQPF